MDVFLLAMDNPGYIPDFQGIRRFIVVVSVSSNILLMEEIVHQLRLVVSPIIYKDLYSLGAGFVPSTVVSNKEYVRSKPLDLTKTHVCHPMFLP